MEFSANRETMAATPAIKICGIVSPDFAVAAENAGVDYLGFIFFPKSPRNLTVDTARLIVSRMSGRAARVGVFVDTPPDEIISLGKLLEFSVVQLHGAYSASAAAQIKSSGFEVWKVAHAAGDVSGEYPCDGVLVDSKTKSMPGGTGEKSDWSLIPAIHSIGRKAVLAGGISPENFAEAAVSGADVLDFNSSLESAPGVKSMERLKQLTAKRRHCFG